MTTEAQGFLGLKDSKGCREGSTAEPQPPEMCTSASLGTAAMLPYVGKGRCRCNQRFGGGEIVLGDPGGPTGSQGSLEEGGRRIRVREMWKNALLLALGMEEGATG